MIPVEQFLRPRLAGALPGAEAQRRFAPTPLLEGWAPDLRPDHARRAAALLLLYPGPLGVTMPLTVRRSDLPHHPGQISLPGGAIDPGETPEAAALRETHEELGLDPAGIRLVGPLSTLWVIVSNFVVHPFVAVMDQPPTFSPAEDEVAELLEVPLDVLLDRSTLRWGRQALRGRDVDYPHFQVHGHAVWGATAMILGEFGSLFDATFGPPVRPADSISP